MRDITEILRSFKGLILDADGVFFTGQEYRAVSAEGEVILMKERSLQDGQGISFLRGLGIKVVFSTGEGQPLDSIVEKINKLPSVMSGAWDPVSYFTDELHKGGKVASLEAWLAREGLSWDDCVYIGDDRTDFEAMQRAGLKVAPANCAHVIGEIADVILKREGGRGAIREFAEKVLDVRDVDSSTLPAA